MNEKQHDFVRHYMVPIEKFPRIPDTATFSGAVIALEQAQEEYLAGKREQRILLVYDNENKIVGKLSPLDVVRGLEPDFDKFMKSTTSSQVAGFDYVIRSMREKVTLWSKPLDDLCSKAIDVQVKDFLRPPSAQQLVRIGDSLNEAFHRFVLGRHDSLFVTDGPKLVGLIRFSDVYREIERRLKDVCRL
ncbi:MAG: hypothetical protein MUD16_16170 [Desulfobacterales bacterium]|nr:hypothetical protein [Desulfobacterales bacterium]